jgi:serine/threonine-protein kinase RsbW
MAQIELQLTLPRDARFVAILRRVATSLLEGLDVPEESVDDVTVALSEACGNVIQHARGTEEYGVRLAVEADQCSIEVRDLGPGFDTSTLAEEPAPDGRGIPLLQALMDDLEFVRDEDTTTVRLVKRWDVLALGRAL